MFQRKYYWPLHRPIIAVLSITILTSTTYSTDVTNFEVDQIRTAGTRLINQHGDPVVLRGMSLFFSHYEPGFYNYDCIKWLRDDWRCNVIRATMGVENGGYLTNPSAEKAKVKAVVDACLNLGIYVIIDWQDYHAEWHMNEAIAFFEEMARQYGSYPNVIYEIYNEPETTDWKIVKSYALDVIPRIRAIDPDNLIIVGTPWWSQYVDLAANDPLPYSNLAYALHFYAASHKQAIRNRAMSALNKGLTLFVSEFGGGDYTGTIGINYPELDAWFKIINDHGISWCNWAVEDQGTTLSALRFGASVTGGWPSSMLTESGLLFRNKIKSGNSTTVTDSPSVTELPAGFWLHQNHPNPFNPKTTITFTVGTYGYTSLRVFDMFGREVAVLVNEPRTPGVHKVAWDASAFPSGVYVCRMRAGNFMATQKMILAK